MQLSTFNNQQTESHALPDVQLMCFKAQLLSSNLVMFFATQRETNDQQLLYDERQMKTETISYQVGSVDCV